ncbi:hypothetical protein GCM10018793_01280 [Streptomyces sulfonofaciens]|uniref:Orc1-like AAA ATPase domain-containing protein n=1 Tax=Streptomyces sulfonofaciens TaxID=68272 RepID=A0A919FMS7_9ACTN|nr:tetratricopeptide repeat protein [Streptomyces sulfonofaciens]GHH69197.1 hypothetical protein GCM10018793_01280 [Streptomyces sulfonofaciens]
MGAVTRVGVLELVAMALGGPGGPGDGTGPGHDWGAGARYVRRTLGALIEPAAAPGADAGHAGAGRTGADAGAGGADGGHAGAGAGRAGARDVGGAGDAEGAGRAGARDAEGAGDVGGAGDAADPGTGRAAAGAGAAASGDDSPGDDARLALLWRRALAAPEDPRYLRALVDGLLERAPARPELMAGLSDLVALVAHQDPYSPGTAPSPTDPGRPHRPPETDPRDPRDPRDLRGPRAAAPPSPAQANSLTGGTQVHGPAIQAGDVHGSIHIHTAPAPVPVALPDPARLPPARPPALHQLPPVPAHFTSRGPDLAALGALLRQKPPTAPLLVVVNGPPGVGKTTLVSAWLHAVAEEFPDGQVYADLHGHSAVAPAEPTEVLGQFLRALGAASVPAEVAEQTSLWRSMTAGLRLAVMLDNAFTAAQVRPLLPGGPDSVVVVTSRNRLTGLGVDGARFHPLGVLDSDASLDLFARGVGRRRTACEPVATRRVVELCGGLPLALCLAAARLAARPRQPVQAMADALGRDAGPLAVLTVGGEAAVRSALDLSYAALGAAAARLYRRLGALPLRTFDTRAAATACALPEDEAERLLDELIEANLLEDAGPGPDGFRFHDLVRDHARAQAAAAESPRSSDEAVRRVCDLYLATATAAEQLLTPAQFVLSRDYAHPPAAPAPFSDGASALRWLDGQRQNLMACVRTAAERAWYDTAWQLVDACWPLFLRLRYYDLWIEAHEIGLACARLSRHPEHREAERQMLNSGAIGLTAARRTDTAIGWYEDALRAARAAGDVRGEGQALHGLGTCHHDAGRPERADAYLHRAIGLWESCGYVRGVGLSLIVLGEVLLATGRPSEAVDRLVRAHEVLAGVNDPHDTTRALALLGRARVVAGDAEAGLAELDRALGLFSAAGSLHWQARTLEMLGESAADRGDRAAALDHFERALALHETTSPADARRVRDRLGEVAGGSGSGG